MLRYIYDLAGFRIAIHSPFAIDILTESKPFMSAGDADCPVSIDLVPVSSLPDYPAKGFWSDEHYFTHVEGNSAVFVCNYPGEAPYALILEHENRLEIRYVEIFEKYLRDSNALLNLIGIEHFLLSQFGFLLHASFISWQGRGILFSAPCGTGKSTQADLWERYEHSRTINGDRAAARCPDGIWTAYGVPFAGTSGIYLRESAPISAIVTLAQGHENKISRLSPKAALQKLLPEISCRRWDALFMGKLMNLLIQLLQAVPVYYLECRPDQGAVALLRDCLLKEVIE